MGFKQIIFKGLHICKTYAPEIMIGASILTGASALYFTVRGTMKLDKILDEHNDDIAAIKNDIPENGEEKAEMSDEVKKELAKRYSKTAGQIALAYERRFEDRDLRFHRRSCDRSAGSE